MSKPSACHALRNDPPVSTADLLNYFHSAAKPSELWRIGAEFEKLAVHRLSGRQLAFDGPDGVGSILVNLAEKHGWAPMFEGENIVGLYRNGATITIEPGGQVELSSSPLTDLFELEQEVRKHNEEILALVNPEKIRWLTVGLSPFSAAEEVALVPKERYNIMNRYLPTRSLYARKMMRTTASIQATFDYSSEEDAVKKFVTAISLSAILSAPFFNAPIYEGKLTGALSHRAQIWLEMDPDRSGFLTDVVRRDEFSFSRWVEYLLDIPMMFYYIGGKFLPAHGRTFRDYMASGYEGRFPTMDDWIMHLTSTFPEVRLKNYLEVRGADFVSSPLSYAVPAVWKGLLYDETSLENAYQLSREIHPEDRPKILSEASRLGLGASHQGRSLRDWAREIVGMASEGLRRQSTAGIKDERPFLDPLLELLERGDSPAADLIKRWESLSTSREKVIDYLSLR